MWQKFSLTPSLLYTLTNAIIFQVGWFICILFGNFWAGLFTLCAFIFHFSTSSTRKADALAVCLCVAIGLIHDSILLHGEFLHFQEGGDFSPLWLVCLWALLGINLHHSLRWIYQRPLIAGGLGAICGPLTYLAGIRLSSAEWISPLIEVIPLIAVLWLFVLPLHRFLSLRILSDEQLHTPSASR
jgi:hypothetical protein